MYAHEIRIKKKENGPGHLLENGIQFYCIKKDMVYPLFKVIKILHSLYAFEKESTFCKIVALK